MNIIKAFQNNEVGINIIINGTLGEPIFRASDIGAVLDMSNIRVIIKDLDNTEKVIHSMDTLGGKQEVTFLTEKGLYQVLFTSRKPIAKKFKNWVCDVIKEIRLSGIYNYQAQIKDQENQLKLKNDEVIESKNENQSNLFINFENKHVVYIIQVEETIVKFGFSKDIRTRFDQHRLEFGPGIKLLHVFETIYNREFENTIKQDSILKQYIVKKKYKTDQTELIKLNDKFSLKDLNNRLNELKKNITGDIISNLTKENTELKEINDTLHNTVKNLEENNKNLEFKISILKKQGHVEITPDMCSCSRCNKKMNPERFDINPASNRPYSLCKICRDMGIEEYEEKLKEKNRLKEIEIETNKQKLLDIRTAILESQDLVKCSRCKDDKLPKDIGINLRNNSLYKLCKICRDCQEIPKNNYEPLTLPDENETECSKCKKNFITELNKISRLNYKTCGICREKDRLNAEKDVKSLKEHNEISKCIYCSSEFVSEMTKKKDGYIKSCIDCRNKRKKYDKTRREVNGDKLLQDKREYYSENKTLIREKQKEYYDNNSEKIIQNKKNKILYALDSKII